MTTCPAIPDVTIGTIVSPTYMHFSPRPPPLSGFASTASVWGNAGCAVCSLSTTVSRRVCTNRMGESACRGTSRAVRLLCFFPLFAISSLMSVTLWLGTCPHVGRVIWVAFLSASKRPRFLLQTRYILLTSCANWMNMLSTDCILIKSFIHWLPHCTVHVHRLRDLDWSNLFWTSYTWIWKPHLQQLGSIHLNSTLE